MKLFLKFIVAASLLTGASSLQAATVDVYITGSSAFRASVTNAIGHLLTSPQAAFVGSAGTGALAASSQQLITGTGTGALSSSNTYFFHTSWSGSLAGLVCLTNNINAATPFLPDTVTTSAMTVGSGAAGTFPDGGTALSASAATTSHTADGAFSDVYQGSTAYVSPVLVQATGTVVGVVPYVLAGNPDTAAFVSADGKTKISNVSSTQLRGLFGSAVDLSQLTGNINDQGAVLPVGRNADSGTRFATFAETGFNPVGAAITQPQQYRVQTAGTSGYAGSGIDVSLYPSETLFPGTTAAQVFNTGASGYGSGSGLAAAMSINGTSGANSDNPSYLIAYAGENDAATIVQAGGSFINFNGVSYGSISGTTVTYNRNLVDQGVYTLWAYEHCYYRNGNANASALTAVSNEIKSVDAPISGEFNSAMAVQRDYEGGPISFVGPGGSSK